MSDAPKRMSLRLEGPYACLVEYVLASDYDEKGYAVYSYQSIKDCERG